LIFPQQRPEENFILSAIYLFPAGNTNKVYYTYRVPYNRLVFEKNNSKYYSEYSVGIEVFDSTGNFIVRSSDGKKIETGDFEKTNMKFVYAEGMVEFEIPAGRFNLLPVFYNLKSGDEVKLPPVDLITSAYLDSKFLRPFITDSLVFYCGDKTAAVLTNFEDNIPFSEQEYNLVIPAADTSLEKIFVTITGDDDTVFNDYVSRYTMSQTGFKKCNERIIVNNESASLRTKNFILSGFSGKTNPGKVKIFISDSSKTAAAKMFEKAVSWYDKPQSLTNPDFAIRALKYIGEEKVMQDLINRSTDNRMKALFDYWKKYDPTPATAFNPLMNEFYQRVDYAAINFTPIAGKSGVDTDRGKILIQFGKPQHVDRTYNEYGKIVETWIYEKPQRKFIFVDLKGTGDFSLTNG
jgi:GWxTD domain-containing protein